MIARTSAVVGSGGTLEALRCEPPLTVRRVHDDDPDVCALCLVGTAAGPLAGDDLSFSLQVTPGARATLRASGASLVQGRAGIGEPAALRMCADVGPGAELSAEPGALIVCAGGRVDVSVRIALAEDAAVDWRELVVLGRTGEAPGAAVLRWDVTRAGHPVLRQNVDLSDTGAHNQPGSPDHGTPDHGTAGDGTAGDGILGDGILGGHRVLASALLAGPHLVARTAVASPTAVAQRLDDRTVLVTVLADDAADARRDLGRLCDRVLGRQLQASPASGASSASTDPSIRP
ncbi:MAG: Urease accessory protein UreD [Pseudonocardiales bacterium]|nr:Urease accessory protein UreD [Pseudonocardiales bacterium]